MLGIGVTATDTEIGKTVVSGALAAAMRHRGYKNWRLQTCCFRMC